MRYKTKPKRKNTSAKNTVFATPPRYPKWITDPGPEEKRIVFSQIVGGVNANAAMSIGTGALNLLNLGAQENQRIGNKVTFKSFEMRGTFFPGTSVTSEVSHTQARVIVIFDKQCRGVAPTLTDYFDTGGAAPKFTDIANFTKNNSRFITLIDYVTRIASESDVNDIMNPVSFHLKKRFSLQTTYQSNNGNVSDIAEGGIFLITGGNGDTAGITSASISTSVVFSYTDQ